MQQFLFFLVIIFWRLQLQYVFKSLAELILEKCKSSWGKPFDYNYISEFLQELHPIFQLLHPYSNFSNYLELDITLQLHCSNYSELIGITESPIPRNP